MKINYKILSIPPYISIAWKHICSLHVENRQGFVILCIGLMNGLKIEIPHLEPRIIELIFSSHAKYLEQEGSSKSPSSNVAESISFGFPLKLGGPGLENLGTIMQHQPEQKNAADLPSEVLSKIRTISKAIGVDESSGIIKAEPHCNCPYCQIARSILNDSEEQEHPKEEIIHEEDLKFRGWDIEQTGDNLYIVSNPIDQKEKYNVYLGEPIGCTCGEKNCEHKLAKK
jgi:hypothetical protein